MIKLLPFRFQLSLFLILSFISFKSVAYTLPVTDTLARDSSWTKKLSIIAEYQYFRTCHHSRFDGGYVYVTYNTSPYFSIGLGVAYNYSKLHVDNGYNLKDVKVLPILADFRYMPFTKWKVRPFAVIDLGYSLFIKYKQEDPSHLEPTKNMNDHGLYTYGGAGIQVKLNKIITLYLIEGYTGMHMSTNDLDVNPRGWTNKVGIKVNVQ
jgi:hypothetical protein